MQCGCGSGCGGSAVASGSSIISLFSGCASSITDLASLSCGKDLAGVIVTAA